MSPPRALVRSEKEHGIEVIGPTRADDKWQASLSKGFDNSHFPIDWEAKRATCPEDQESLSWTPAIDNRKNEGDLDQMLRQGWQDLPSQPNCTHAESRAPRRRLPVRPQEQYEALQAARQRQTVETFSKRYAARSGREATISTSGCVPLACVVRALLARPRPICNILALQLR